MRHTRRQFLADVGKGMLVAGLGPALASDLGVGPAWAAEAPPALEFGKLEPLVCLIQETKPEQMMPLIVKRVSAAENTVEEVVAAAALANARTFGGEDYVGFHTLMALSPAYHMSRELPAESRLLPILKVLYRNCNRIQEKGGRKNEVLKPVAQAELPAEQRQGTTLRDAVRRKSLKDAEATFATLATGSASDTLNHLLWMVEDGAEVHRVVLVSRAWDLLDLVGRDRAHTMLRQSVHFCIRGENNPRYVQYWTGLRSLLPRLLDQHKLEGRELGKKTAEDGWVQQLSEAIFKGTPDQAAEATAAALAEGFTPDAVGEAISLVANQLVLRDNGRPGNEAPHKPKGSVHGDGIGVHASDSANAWRNLARAANPRHTHACLILGAYQVALDRGDRGGNFLKWEPYPRTDARERLKVTEPEALLREADDAIKNRDQARATAAVQRYGEGGHPARPVFDLFLRYATSEDGALHAEKYYRTVSEEFQTSRPAFRWRQLVALARVTASEYGYPAPGYSDACKLLKA